MLTLKQLRPHYRTPRVREVMARVALIKSLFLARHPKPIDAKGKPADYNSEVFQHLEEMIQIAEDMHEQGKPPPVEDELREEITRLKGDMKVLRRCHANLKESNVKLRRLYGN